MMSPLASGWVSGFLLLIDAALVYAFFVHARSLGFKRWNTPEAGAGIALMVYFFGRGLVQSGTWIGIHHFSTAACHALFGVGTAIALIGAICVVRVFSRRTWRTIPWIIYVAIAALASATVEYVMVP